VKKQKKRKGGKQLLSFGDDEGDVHDEPVLKKAKFDTRIVVDDDEQPMPRRKDTKKQISKASTAHLSGTTAKTAPVGSETPRMEAEAHVEKSPPRRTRKHEASSPSRDPLSDSEVQAPKKSLLEKTNEEIAALKASMKRTTHAEPVKEKKKTALEQLIPETSTRGRKRRPGGNSAAKDDLTALHMLEVFKSKLKQVPEENIENGSPALTTQDGSKDKAKAEHEGEGERNGGDEEDTEVCDLHFIANCQSCQSWDKREAEEESGDEGWMAHTLSFAADKLGKDLSYRKKAEEELVVIDPLEKARTLKEEKKAARDARVGGKSRAWDQDRNSQATVLSGRSAK
jgi:peptidyl-prolyl cis-trans isomerase SDCCAG10